MWTGYKWSVSLTTLCFSPYVLKHKTTRNDIIRERRNPFIVHLGLGISSSEVSCYPSCLHLTTTAGACSSVWKASLVLAQKSLIASHAAPLCQRFPCHLKCVFLFFFVTRKCADWTFCDLSLAAKCQGNSATRRVVSELKIMHST